MVQASVSLSRVEPKPTSPTAAAAAAATGANSAATWSAFEQSIEKVVLMEGEPGRIRVLQRLVDLCDDAVVGEEAAVYARERMHETASSPVLTRVIKWIQQWTCPPQIKFDFLRFLLLMLKKGQWQKHSTLPKEVGQWFLEANRGPKQAVESQLFKEIEKLLAM